MALVMGYTIRYKEVSLAVTGRKKVEQSKGTAKLSLYVPPRKGGAKVLSRLHRLAERHDRSLNYLAVEAILQYLDREEKRG